jgi:hypothetical protein
MQAEWTHHLKTPEEKERFKKYVLNNRTLLERLSAIVDQWNNELTSEELSPKVYESPSWGYHQADINGYRRCIRDFQKILTLDQKDKNGGQPI